MKKKGSDSNLSEKSEVVRSLGQHSFIIALGIFITSFAVPDGLGTLPFQFLLKNEIGVTAETMSIFLAVAGFAWYIKPLAGLLADSIPLWGSRRRSYLLFSSMAGSIAWLIVGAVHSKYFNLLASVVVLNSFVVIASSIVGAQLVEGGRQHAATGRLSSLRLIVMAFSVVLTGLLGGWLASRPFVLTAKIGAFLLFALWAAVFLMFREKPLPPPNSSVSTIIDIRSHFNALVRSWDLWIVMLLLCLVTIAPGFETPLFYYQTNMLKFSPQAIGELRALYGGFGLLGAVFYIPLCKRLPLRSIIVPVILLHVLATTTYLGYHSLGAAQWITSVNGLTLGLMGVALYDLLARATPIGNEATGYALMASVGNATLAASNVLGSWLYTHYGLNFMSLIWLNAGTTLMVLPTFRLLPQSLTDSYDGVNLPLPITR